MKSPFPGMDPYLERHWGDVHSSIITLAKIALQPQLGGGLVARSGERVYIDDEEALRRQLRVPNVRVVEMGITDVPVRADGNVALAEPVVINVESEPVREGYLQILDVSQGGKVITIIEFLSPSNKLYEAARASYLAKQEECIASRVNLVEVDLTRTGRRELLVNEKELPAEKRGEYLVSVYRAYSGRLGRREGYGLKLRERLAGIRIPLRSTDPDVVLDLQSLVDRAYEAGAYGHTIDYTRPCDPPLDGEDATWAEELLRSAGRRA